MRRPSTWTVRWLVIVAVGAVWRLGVLIVDRWDKPLLLNDSLYYSAQAMQLADGIFFREPFSDQPGAEHGPLTSTLLALVSWVDQPTPWQRLATVVFGIATVALIGLLARRVGGDRVGIVATVVAAAYPNLWMNDGLVMSESVSLLLVTAILLVAARTPAPSVRQAVLLGALAGLAALARSELALFVPFLAVWLWLGRRDEGASGVRGRLIAITAMAGASLLVVAPWVTFNLVRFEETVTLTTNDGTTLIGSYCDESFSGAHPGGWSLSCVVNEPQYRFDEEPSVRSSRQKAIARQYALDHLDELPRVVLARLGRTLDLYDLGNLVHQEVGEERYRWASWSGIVCWWILAPLAAVGFFRIGRRMRWLFAVPAVGVVLVSAVFYGAHRIRSPLEPVVVVLAAVILVALVDRRRNRVADAAGAVA